MTKRQINIMLITAAIILAVVTPVQIGRAYFSDYDNTYGTATVHLSGQTEIVEEPSDKEKVIAIRNTGSAPVTVRLAIYGPSELSISMENSSDWSRADGDEFYYYTQVLEPGETTSKITASLENIPASMDYADLEITVIHESAPLVYEDGSLRKPDGWDNMPEIKY